MRTYISQRGSIIVYTMMTMAVMLAVGVTLTGLFIGKLKRARAAQDSTIAIYTADSAAERCLYEARTGIQASPPLTLMSDAAYSIMSNAVDVTSDCSAIGGSGTFTIRVIGTYHGISRALEINQ